MPIHSLSATLEAPISIALSRQATSTGTVDHVPGSTLRGALAARWIFLRGEPTPGNEGDFAHLFLDEDATRFRPLWPGPVALPRTAAECKRYPGLPRPRAQAAVGPHAGDEGHGVFDLLLRRAARCAPGDRCPRMILRGPPEESCDEPLRPVAAGRRFARETGPAAGARRPFAAARVDRAQRTHVGIDRTLRTKAEGYLYSEETLLPWMRAADPRDGAPVHERVTLAGAVETDARGRDLVARLLAEMQGLVFLGGSRTRGLGEVRLALGEPVAERGPRDWLAAGQRAAEEILKRSKDAPGQDGRPDKRWDPARTILLALHFPAGAILVDDLLRATNDVRGALPWLPPLPPDGDAEAAPEVDLGSGLKGACVFADAELATVRGWNAAHGLPRGDDLALVPGSVVAYRVRGEAAAIEDLLARLHAASKTGIGLRRNEGFGRVIVNDPVHVELAL